MQNAYAHTEAKRQQLVQSAGCSMAHATLAEGIIAEVGDRLNQAWYHAAVVQDNISLWDFAVAKPDQLMIPPPYKLTARQKAHLLGVLEELSELPSCGPRLFADGTWDADSREVCRWLTLSAAPSAIFGPANSAVLSPVPGDLNGNNILLSLERAYPFLIDFACYQSRGHTFQDFARLEAEVKFSLMDRDQDSLLHGLDYAPEQLSLWCGLEDQLASHDWPGTVVPASPNCMPTKRAANLIIQIRQRAERVHASAYNRAGALPSHFLTGYNAALLYHTLRAVGYDFLSPFKRLLAIYSAAKLIRLLIGVR